MDTVGKSEGTAPSNNKEDLRRGNLTQRLASAYKRASDAEEGRCNC